MATNKIIFIVSFVILAVLIPLFYLVVPHWTYLPYKIDPVIFSLGPFRLHWYGFMYVAAFLTSYSLVAYRLRTEKRDITVDTLNDFVNWLVWGVLLGGRLGYAIFYKPVYFLKNPWEIFLPFQYDGQQWFFGIYGMSYHGGLLGVILAFYWFCKKHKLDVWRLSDLIVPAIPLGYAFGRLGNFINGELFGRVTDMPWGMYFPADPANLRHPSQLYEMFFEGILLFIFIWSVKNKEMFRGKISAIYLIGYGAARFFLEYFREPDTFLGYFAGGLTMGQLLCAGMIAAGVWLYNKKIFDKYTNQ